MEESRKHERNQLDAERHWKVFQEWYREQYGYRLEDEPVPEKDST